MRIRIPIQTLLYDVSDEVCAKQIFPEMGAALDWLRRNFEYPAHLGLYVRGLLRRPSLALNDRAALGSVENPAARKADLKSCVHWSAHFYCANGEWGSGMQRDGPFDPELFASLLREGENSFAVLRCCGAGPQVWDWYAATVPGPLWKKLPEEPHDPAALYRLARELVREERWQFLDPALFCEARRLRARIGDKRSKEP